MPKLLNSDLEQHVLPTNNYGFSAVRIADLGASEYTLVTLVVDSSGSTMNFRHAMTQAIKDMITSCKYSPRAANLLIRLVEFDHNLREIHGFKMLSQCDVADYDNCLTLSGTTALYDASENSISAMVQYGKDLTDQEFSVNAITVVITDGENNAGKLSAGTVSSTMKKAVQSEALESLVSILVGVNVRTVNGNDELAISTADAPALATFRSLGPIAEFGIDAGFTQYIGMSSFDAKKAARLADFVSKSISSQSQSLGTGGPSQSLSF